MKRRALTLCFLAVFFVVATAQKVQTIVPVKPVVTGAAFQVQYVITGATDIHLLQDPAFDHFRVVSGPNYYRGNIVLNGALQHVENITYTLVPLAAGTYRIKGITVTSGPATHLKSEDADVTVVQPSVQPGVNQPAPVTFYAPTSGQATNQLIRNNLFLRVDVDKKQVYIGEPVVAVFTLYSRLPSFSEVIKTPGFYGFSVLDMLDISAPRTGVETVGGTVYNTSILRKVELYPSIAGKLTIDAMHVANEIQLEDSLTHTVREVNYELVSKPVTVKAKALPVEKPASFNGAVGIFTIDGSLAKNVLQTNEQGRLILKLAGKGNFIQFGAPEIQWPSNILAQDPVITENFKKDTAPLEGQRTFEYRFTAEVAEDLILAPVRFTYFNPATAKFVTLVTDSLPLHIQPSAVRSNLLPGWVHKARQHKKMILLWITLLLFLILAIRWLIRKRPAKATPVIPSVSYTEKLDAIDLETISEQQACMQILAILNEAFQAWNRPLTPSQEMEWKAIQDECRLRIYSGASQEDRKAEMKQRAVKLLESL